jgi:N6-L-threonylcarbamoyladenine synthase
VLQEVATRFRPDVSVRFPAFDFCTDNAAMVAGAGAWLLRRGEQSGLESDVFPRLPLAQH